MANRVTTVEHLRRHWRGAVCASSHNKDLGARGKSHWEPVTFQRKWRTWWTKNGSGWKGEQRWQGVHLQLAYCGMLIRPAKTSHLPPKCHILSGRDGDGFRLTSVGQTVLWFVCLFQRQFLFCSLLPRAFFSLNIPRLRLSALLLCCLLCDEWLHFNLSFFFLPSFSWNRLQSMQLCGNKIDLAKKHGGGREGRKENIDSNSSSL